MLSPFTRRNNNLFFALSACFTGTDIVHLRLGGRILMRSIKMQIRPAFLMLAAVVLAIAGLSSSVRADAVGDWNAIAVQSVVTAARPGASGAIDIAMVQAAVYDAVQYIEGDYEPYYLEVPLASGDPAAATAKAAHDILVSRFPAQAGALDAAYQNYLTSHGIPANDPG